MFLAIALSKFVATYRQPCVCFISKWAASPDIPIKLALQQGQVMGSFISFEAQISDPQEHIATPGFPQ